MNKEKIAKVGAIAAIYIVASLLSYFTFSKFLTPTNTVSAPPVAKGTEGQTVFDTQAPKTEECPLNGALYSKKQKDWWEKHRPLGIMIENHEEARPQSGLSFADVVYEAVAEGGITRYLAVFHCQDAGIVGPVRSARTYYLDFISEYGNFPLYAHVGGANQPGPADALSQINSYDWGGYNDMNQFSIGFPTFWRDYDRLGHTVATEHTMYSTTEKLWSYAKDSRKLTNVDKDGVSWDESFVSYGFKDDVSLSERPQAQTIHLEFWDSLPLYFVDWKYDKATNAYKRFHGSSAHLDKNTGKQLVAKNVVVLYMQELNANDGYENNAHLLYKDKGTGKADIFMDGKKVTGTWRKNNRTSRTLLFDGSGNSIEFNRGLIWFGIMPIGGTVEVK